jgi:hypothetical protein
MFLAHGHDSDNCDVIVCGNVNWAECSAHIEVIELSSIIKRLVYEGSSDEARRGKRRARVVSRVGLERASTPAGRRRSERSPKVTITSPEMAPNS